MKRSSEFIVGVVALCLSGASVMTSCDSNQRTKLDIRTADGYFVRNDINEPTSFAEKVTTRDRFNELFGMAATSDTRPTEINFDKDFAAVVVLPESSTSTRINVDSIVWNGSRNELYYTVYTGGSNSFTSRPALVLLIDRKYDGSLDVIVNGYNQDPSLNAHNSRTSLDYTGTYEGTIPCADCQGIEVSVSLTTDGNYIKTMTYLGKGPGNVFRTTGSYRWDESGNVIELLDEGDNDMYRVEENRLVMLDRHGNPISGDLANNYILQKR